jgi:hypothetical protein
MVELSTTGLVQHLTEMEREIGLPDRFLLDLVEESDWSFVIKLHALLEAALAQALVAEIGDTRLSEIVSRLTLQNKLRWAGTLGILGPPDTTLMDRLARIRNYAAHSLDGLSFTFSGYVESLSAEERSSTLKALLPLGDGPSGGAGSLFQVAPRAAVWVNATATLARLAALRKVAASRAAIRGIYERVAQDMLDLTPSDIARIAEPLPRPNT